MRLDNLAEIAGARKVLNQLKPYMHSLDEWRHQPEADRAFNELQKTFDALCEEVAAGQPEKSCESCRDAFISGYEMGHNDTVEGNYIGVDGAGEYFDESDEWKPRAKEN